MKHILKIRDFIIKHIYTIVGIIILFIFFTIFKQYFYYDEIRLNKKETIGTIYKIRYSSRGSYQLYYHYEIDNVKYYGSTGIENFVGDNGRKGCVGCSFKVYYSSKDKQKSTIRLGKYEKYKTKVEFVNFD